MNDSMDPGLPSERYEDHPSPEKLSGYQANELTPEEAEAIQEHLAGCSLCAEVLLDLQRFLHPPPEDRPREGVTDFESAAELRDLLRKIEDESRKVPLRRSTETRPSRRFPSSLKAAYALAAVFAMATLGLSLYVQSLRQDLRSSQLNSAAVYLPSDRIVRGGEDSTRTVQLPASGEKFVALTLELSRRSSYPEYQVEIQDREDKKVFVARGLNRQLDGQEYVIRFVLSSRYLHSGLYKVRLEGLKTGKADLVEQYEFELIRK
jgi:hypothetical protein